MSDGAEDCKNGIPHKSGKGEKYDNDYAEQYEAEQIETHRSEENE